MQEKILSDQVKILTKQRGLFLILTLMFGFICCGLTLKLITTRDKTILVPGLAQEVWLSQGKVSESYIEEISLMYLSMLLDLNKDVIGYKEALISKYISHSSAKYMKAIRQYFSHAKEQYKKFGLSTYFSVKSLEVNTSDNSVIAKGILTTKFGDHGIDVKEVSYFMSFDLAGSNLRLKEFRHIESEADIKKKEEELKVEEEKMQKIEEKLNKRKANYENN
uniref:TraE/TraK family type IV conjugative transfer system protein n=1 Tax=Rickettsia endosymbiont of Ixodes pacificus TaxID=1133329 RepID=UPI00067A639B|nr:TraE/TraK family type IV conjugative transfer system protein [Rickettsia endosymbiont of Ixodes pacificus]AKS10394.1 TraE protein [Rickettsia endosymbiont of Ixodes pacificus]